MYVDQGNMMIATGLSNDEKSGYACTSVFKV